MSAQFSLNSNRDGVVTDLGSRARTVRNYQAAAATLDEAVAASASIAVEEVTEARRVAFLISEGGRWPQ